MERNPLIMSTSEMSDLPPEVLEIIFSDTNLTTKKELRLVCKSWQQIIDRRIVDFRIRDLRTQGQLKAFLDSSVKEFRLVKMEFTWGVKFPKYLLKDGHNFNTHKIKELVFAKPSYKVNRHDANTSGDSEVLKFFINFLKSGCHGVEHLNIHSEIMAHFIVSELERAMASCAPWNTVQKLSLAVSPRETDEEQCPDICLAPLKAFLKFTNIPNLYNVRFVVRRYCGDDDDSEEIQRSALIAIIVVICKFLLRYKQTLRHVFLLFEQTHRMFDLEKDLGFMENEGPLQLESFVLEFENPDSDALGLGYIASACTERPGKLRTFGYTSYNNYCMTAAQLNIANELLERILSQNISTIEDLTLGMQAVNFKLFRHCQNLKTLKFGEVNEIIFQESSSKFLNMTRLKIQNKYCLKPEFVNWLLEHCPNLTFLEIALVWSDCAYFLKIQSILLKFDKLKEILLFEVPDNATCVELQSNPEFKCVRKLHPSTSEPYVSIQVIKS